MRTSNIVNLYIVNSYSSYFWYIKPFSYRIDWKNIHLNENNVLFYYKVKSRKKYVEICEILQT